LSGVFGIGVFVEVSRHSNTDEPQIPDAVSRTARGRREWRLSRSNNYLHRSSHGDFREKVPGPRESP